MGVHGIFATHLHEIFQLPLRLNTVRYKRMGLKLDGTSALWTYTLEDGFCDDSRALETARAYQLPSGIVERAAELIDIFPNICRGSSEPAMSKTLLAVNQLERDSQSFDALPASFASAAKSEKRAKTVAAVVAIEDPSEGPYAPSAIVRTATGKKVR